MAMVSSFNNRRLCLALLSLKSCSSVNIKISGSWQFSQSGFARDKKIRQKYVVVVAAADEERVANWDLHAVQSFDVRNLLEMDQDELEDEVFAKTILTHLTIVTR